MVSVAAMLSSERLFVQVGVVWAGTYCFARQQVCLF